MYIYSHYSDMIFLGVVNILRGSRREKVQRRDVESLAPLGKMGHITALYGIEGFERGLPSI